MAFRDSIKCRICDAYNEIKEKNEQDILSDIIEKSVSSNHVSIGIYGFSSAQKYQKKTGFKSIFKNKLCAASKVGSFFSTYFILFIEP